MKLKLMIAILVALIINACCKEDAKPTDGRYPIGITISDTTSINDCSLSECSDDRIVRLVANNVTGKLFKLATEDSTYFINYPASFDSQIQLILCELPQEFQLDIVSGLEVKYSGSLIDACGIREAVWPIEELYYLKLSKIEKL